MKKLWCYLLLAAFISTILGCGLAAREIKLKSQSERTDVFKEVKEEGPPPQGFFDLNIKASIKTNLEGYYFFESAKTYHSRSGYPFLINIDGQSLVWKIDGQKEISPGDAHGKRDPEGGEGMRYVLHKKVRLVSGPHNLFLGLPGEDYFKEVSLTLPGRGPHVLEFKPIYRSKRGRSTRSFLNGVKRGEMFLDGNLIK